MPRPLHPVHRFTLAITVLGAAVMAGVFASADEWVRPGAALYAALLVPGVVLGELLPLKIPRRGDDEEIAFSTTFSFALLIAAGLPVALAAQGLASVVQDRHAGKALWRTAFNVGQYVLTLAAASWVLDLVATAPLPAALTSAELPAIAAAGAVFFAVNFGIVGTAIALYQRSGLLRYLRRDLLFSAATSTVLLSLAPVVLATVHVTPWLYPACLLPIAAVYEGCRQALRSEHQATHDSLTGLANRARLHTLMRRAVGEAAGGAGFAVMLMDLNRFKEINDTLGHLHGDLLLRQVGERLATAVRPGDHVARWGGDEFVVLVSDLPGPATAEAVAGRVRQALQRPFTLGDLTIEVDASIGIATYPEDGEDADTLLQRADIAMYHAKQAHLPHARYAAEHDHHSPARLAVAADLRRALGGEEVVPWYQPQLDLGEDHVRAVEALVRWNHPTLGLLGPAAFVEVAESTGLIRALTLRVLDVALRDRLRWAEDGWDLAVAVNVSVRSLLDRHFPAEVARHLDDTGTPAAKLKLEITESTVMADPATALQVLGELAAMGVALAIDDFGTGYSSLAYLKQLPVGELKIDRSFVMNMDADRDDALIVRSTIDLGHNLGLRVIAEGVENAGTLEVLRSRGCDGVQGYHLSRPVPADRLPAALRAIHAQRVA